MKEKRSFFERITGSRKLPDDDMPASGPSFDYPPQQSMGMGNYSIHTQPSPPQEDYTVETASQPAATQEDETWSGGESEGQLTIDVYQTDNDIVIKSTIAGVKPEDLDVSINNDMVTIRGERKNDEKVETENYYYQECYWGTFSRSVILPVEVLADRAEAAMKNGILTIRLPKADTTKSKRIQVRGF